MKVRQLLRRLERVPEDANVLMSSTSGGSESEAEELKFVRLSRSKQVVYLLADKQDEHRLLSDSTRTPVGAGRPSIDAIRAQALERCCTMLESGDLLGEDAFRKGLAVGKKRFAAMVDEGTVFGLKLDGQTVYPSILCNRGLRLQRLWGVSKILVPAPPVLRFDFLTSRSGALRSRAPVDLLADDRDYRELRKNAKAWVSEFSRTTVKVVAAEATKSPAMRETLYTCATEVDPRRPLWKRALEAVCAPGYQFPHNVPRCPPLVLLIVERRMAGQDSFETEAKVVCDLQATELSVSVAIPGELSPAIKFSSPGKRPTVAEVAEAVFASLAKS
ncbi:hypothetical protein [Caballeronia sp. LZ001]|uniref:hypothetical protein n=1 Tax=Caballeronia sp. LZ001 TaxID=3038553 RepID=UPI0028676C3F|nr:hypothetical protein [Caballeronia sp. LZ001]MDR5803756.1 hypothetical protein [Caballeronia sp. LZ001]